MIWTLITFPFRLLGMIGGLILSLCGKLFTILIGLFMIIGGALMCLSLVGLPAGIVLILIGIATALKGLFV